MCPMNEEVERAETGAEGLEKWHSGRGKERNGSVSSGAETTRGGKIYTDRCKRGGEYVSGRRPQRVHLLEDHGVAPSTQDLEDWHAICITKGTPFKAS